MTLHYLSTQVAQRQVCTLFTCDAYFSHDCILSRIHIVVSIFHTSILAILFQISAKILFSSQSAVLFEPQDVILRSDTLSRGYLVHLHGVTTVDQSQ